MAGNLPSTAGLPDPQAYEDEYRYWPWGSLIDRAVALAAEFAPPGGYVLDYMCGTGFLLSHLMRARPDLRVCGCDAKPEFVAYAHAKYPGVDVVLADAREFTPDRPADLIICLAGLHHLPFGEQQAFLQKLRRECHADTHVLIGEEVLRGYLGDADRTRAALDLNCDLLHAGLTGNWPIAVMAAGIEVLRNDVLCDGEYKRDLREWLDLIEADFQVIDIAETWKAPSGGGDNLIQCRPLSH